MLLPHPQPEAGHAFCRGQTCASCCCLTSAHIFVCGDGAAMSKDVNAALLDILQSHGGKSLLQASAHLSRMTSEARYIRDIWS